MSEYEFVGFQAVDCALDDEQLAFAERQSTRAEVSRWSFTVDYRYSSFRGDVDGLLRRGYDVFLRFTNYGEREIRLHLPNRPPFDKSIWAKYVDGERFRWKSGNGKSGTRKYGARKSHGILTLRPYIESGDIDEPLDTRRYFDAAIHARELLMNGDARALYLLWLCAANDDNDDPAQVVEPPVPHGVADLTDRGGPLLEFFGLDPLLLVAAGQGLADDEPGLAAAPRESLEDQSALWVNSLDERSVKDRLLRLLVGDPAREKAKLLVEIRESRTPDGWPSSDMGRTLDELLNGAETLRADEKAKQARKSQEAAKRQAAKAQRERVERVKEMRNDPAPWLRKVDTLVNAKGTANYKAPAEILRDLREAVGGAEGNKITRLHAAHLVEKHPTLTQLKGSLRKQGLLE